MMSRTRLRLRRGGSCPLGGLAGRRRRSRLVRRLLQACGAFLHGRQVCFLFSEHLPDTRRPEVGLQLAAEG